MTGARPGGVPPAPPPGPGPFLLRPWQEGDLPLVMAAAADPYTAAVTTLPDPCDEAAARRYIDGRALVLSRGIGVPLVIADARTGQGVGGLTLSLRDAAEGRASLGYWVAPAHRRRGAAAHALGLAAAWAHDALGVPRLELAIEPWNTGSLRAAETAGFRREGLMRQWQEIGGERRDLYLYARLAADPRPGPAAP
ncbi:GNAT family N-acetyltransferase [Nocardiopsis sp. CC223A]|uniref:GNAT family N-acetyltransferase n=1 Tax=Nocardiopsis sp. CC223A TaxID=3044051 RepID=UPI00278C1FF5|nr:GNAT family protein [Nocardiopsis sp. CC223A]